MNQPNARRLVLEILNAIEVEEAYSNLALQEALRKNDLKSEDKKLISRMVYGVLENRIRLDYCIQKYSKTKLKKIQLSVLNILRLSVYQIDFMERIPNSAVVNEAVKLTKKFNQKSSGFVNGILRSYIRGNGCIIDKEAMNSTSFLSITYSHPLWLIERMIEQWGEEKTELMLAANNSTPDLSLRVNKLKTKPQTLLDALRKEGVEASLGSFLEESLIIDKLGKNSIDELSSFIKGDFTIQDISSMLVGYAVKPEPGDLIMDVCAAPGGKTTHLSELMNNQGQVIALDIHPHKMDLINENAQRLGILNIKAQCQDATELLEVYSEKADKVLVDAPCSGLGIIRRKPEIRYTKGMEDILELSKLQLQILNTAAQYVKKNGQLIYSTCTIDKEENVNNVNKFLEQNPNFVLDDVSCDMPEQLKTKGKMIQILPGDYNLDGFFIARLTKKND